MLRYYTYVILEEADLKDAVSIAYGALLACDSKPSEMDESEASGDLSDERKQDFIDSSSDRVPGYVALVSCNEVLGED